MGNTINLSCYYYFISITTSVFSSLSPETISAIPNLGSTQLSFPLLPARELQSTAGKLIKSSHLILLQMNSFPS